MKVWGIESGTYGVKNECTDMWIAYCSIYGQRKNKENKLD